MTIEGLLSITAICIMLLACASYYLIKVNSELKELTLELHDMQHNLESKESEILELKLERDLKTEFNVPAKNPRRRRYDKRKPNVK